MIKFLVDKNVGLSIVDFLRNEGYDTKSISEVSPSLDDISILKSAVIEERVIITNDIDFGYLVYKTKLPSPSVILFRMKEESPRQKIDGLNNDLSLGKEKISNHFIVVSENKIRLRSLE